MAFTNLFRRYSNSNDISSASFACVDQNSIAEALLDELETQCRTASSLSSLKTNSDVYEDLPSSTSNGTSFPVPKRHASVDYSWLTPNKSLLQAANEVYHLSDIIKMELSELIRNVLPEDCTTIINQFRKEIRLQTKALAPESIIALFRKTIAEYLDQKPKTRPNVNANVTSNQPKSSMNSCGFGRGNRVNPKYQPEDERQCIAELTEISITSSSNDGGDHQPTKARPT